MSQINTENAVELERAEGLQVEVNEPVAEQVQTEEDGALPVTISDSVTLNGAVDGTDPVEVIKAIFIQYGTDYGQVMRTQLDQVNGVYTLTSFGNPTLQFLYHSNPENADIPSDALEEIKRTVYVSGFPADDAIAILEMVLNMQKRLTAKGFGLAIAGVIAPVQTENGQNVLISDFDQVVALSARASFLMGRATLKRLEDAQKASVAAEEAVQTETEEPQLTAEAHSDVILPVADEDRQEPVEIKA